MPYPIEVLQSARTLLSDPARWTRWAGARDSSGCGVDVDDPKAVAWCLVGALAHCGATDRSDEAIVYVEDAIMRRVGRWLNVTLYNDDPERTHADILAVLNDAIRECTNDLIAAADKIIADYMSEAK